MTPNCDARDQETLKITSHINIDLHYKYMLLYFIQRKSNFQYFLFYTAKRRLKRKKKQ